MAAINLGTQRQWLCRPMSNEVRCSEKKTKQKNNETRVAFFFAFQKATLPVARLAPIPQAFFRFDRRSLVLTQKRRPISNQGLAVHFFICGENFEKKTKQQKNPPRSPWKVITTKRPRTGAQQKTKKKKDETRKHRRRKKNFIHHRIETRKTRVMRSFFFVLMQTRPDHQGWMILLDGRPHRHHRFCSPVGPRKENVSLHLSRAPDAHLSGPPFTTSWTRGTKSAPFPRLPLAALLQ